FDANDHGIRGSARGSGGVGAMVGQGSCRNAIRAALEHDSRGREGLCRWFDGEVATFAVCRRSRDQRSVGPGVQLGSGAESNVLGQLVTINVSGLILHLWQYE